VGVGELHPTAAEGIEVWRVDVAKISAKRLDVSVAEVVSQDEHDVGAIGRGGYC
jgi:hypothetical protein